MHYIKYGIIFIIILFNSCITYTIQTGIRPCSFTEKKGLFSHKDIALSSDSIQIKGFFPCVDCFSYNDLLEIQKQIPNELKRHSFEFILKSGFQKECLGYFELNYSYRLKNQINNVSYPLIVLSDSTIVNFSNNTITKNDISELVSLFDSEIIDRIVQLYNRGKIYYSQPYLTKN